MKIASTWEMLQLLGLKDTATNQDGYHVGYDHKGNLLMWSKNEEKPRSSESHRFQIYYPFFHKDEWTINHAIIDFDEAMEAFTIRKQAVAYIHTDNQEFTFNPMGRSFFKAVASSGIDLNDLLYGKWRILSKEEL